jgi:hypothetical protein
MASEEYKESEMAKIVKRLMDEEGFEFGEAVREAMEQTKNFESKADGGSIGIEVLFTDKMKNGGRVPAVSGGFLKLLAEGTAKGKKGIMELVESGKGRFDEFVETMNQSKKPSELIDSVDIPQYLIKSDEPMTLAKMNLDRKTIDTIENTYKLGLYDEMPEVIKAKNLLERFTKPVGSSGFGTSDRVIDYKRAEDILNVKLNGDETIDELFEIEFRTRPDKIPDQGLADGGRVGLFMGGPALEGQALNIYNSMNAYGFSDQEIANALQGQGLYTPGGSTPDTPSDNIIGSQINQGGGGEGITELQETFTTLPGDPKNFRLSQLEGTTDYFPPTTMMGKTKNFIQEKFFQPKVKGTLGDRLLKQSQGITSKIPTLTNILGNLRSPFNPTSPTYNPLLSEQLNFLELGDNLIGRDPNTGGLKYGSGSVLSGKNVISGFGTNDYETALRNFISKMNANKKISTERKTARLAAAEAELAALLAKTEADRAAQYGQTDYGRGSDGQRSYSGDALGDKDQGFGIGATTGGPVSNKTGRGRTGYSEGGLATMFTRRR